MPHPRPIGPSGPVAQPSLAATASPARPGLGDLTNQPRPASASKSSAAARTREEGAHDDGAEGALALAAPPPQKPVSALAERLRQAQAQAVRDEAEAEAAEGEEGEGGEGEERESSSNAKRKKKPLRLEVLGDKAIRLVQKIDDGMNTKRGEAVRAKRLKASSASDNGGVEASAPTSQVAEPGQSASSGETTQKSWRQRAKETIWTNTKSIKGNFPSLFPKNKLVPPQYLLQQYNSPLLKAHAAIQWSKLSHPEQKYLKKQFQLMDVYDKAVEKERAKLAKSKQKKRQRDDRRNATKRKKSRTPKPTDTGLPPMTSKVLNNGEAARKSASEKQLGAQQKERKRYDPPVKPSHLNDKAARAAKNQLNVQFGKSARSITPPPDADTSNWAKSQSMLVHLDTLKPPPRRSGTSKSRNVLGKDAAKVAVPNIQVCMASGGLEQSKDILAGVLQSGKYDDIVRARFAEIQAREQRGLAPSNDSVNFTLVDNGEDLIALQEQKRKERAAAEKRRTSEEIANDPKVGAVQEQFSFQELDDELLN